jgi:hypothetical protein
VTPRRPLTRPMLLVALAAAVSGAAGCTSHVDTVNPDSYLGGSGDGMYRVQTPAPDPSAPVGVVYPEACQSPPSFSGAPESC